MMNKTKTECETKLCQYDSATRTRFYNGMLLTAEHLRAEQDYHREAIKRLNRNLFGSGIVCGLEVDVKPRGLCVKINPGAALDCCGNLIEVCKCITVDLTNLCKDCFGAGCLDPNDPNPKLITRYLVLRYAEKFTDPEQVFTQGDECSGGEKPNCEASKVREGYCIELLDYCPCAEKLEEPTESLQSTLKQQYERGMNRSSSAPSTTGQASTGQTPLPEGHKECIDLPLPCVPCDCCENTNGVGLAKLTIDCAKSIITIDDCKACRRYVISPRFLSWLFSRLQSRNYLSREMEDVYQGLGHLPTAHAIATVMVLEDRVKRTDATDKKIEDDRKRVDEGVKRMAANEKAFAEYKKRVDDQVKRMEANEKAVADYKKRADDQVKRMEANEKAVADYKKKVDDQEKIISDLQKKVK